MGISPVGGSPSIGAGATQFGQYLQDQQKKQADAAQKAVDAMGPDAGKES